MKQSDGKIGSKELMALILIAIGSKIAETTPTSLVIEGKPAGWMVPLVSGLVFLGPFLLLLSLLHRHQGEGLIGIAFKVAGKWAGTLIGATVFGIGLVSTVANSRNYMDAMLNVVFPTTPLLALYGVFMALVLFVAVRGFESLGRTAWMLVPYTAFLLLLMILLSLSQLRPDHLFPILGPGPIALVKSGARFSASLGEVLVVAVLYRYVRSHKDFVRGSSIALTLSILGLSVFTGIYVMLFDYRPAQQVMYPFMQVIRTIQISRFLNLFESFFAIFWASTAVLRIAIYLYVTVAAFAYTLRLIEFEPLLLPFAGLTLMLGLIPENPIQTIEFLRTGILYQVTWVVICSLPPLLWVLDWWKRRQTR